MKNLRVYPSTLTGNIKLPSSKSHTLRALFFAALSEGTSTIYSPLISNDSKAMIKALKSFGVNISSHNDRIIVEGRHYTQLKTPTQPIHVGESGIVYRFITALSCLFSEPITITGSPSLIKNRPIDSLLNSLRSLGAKIRPALNGSSVPFTVKGPIQFRDVTVDGFDSQFVSALINIFSLSSTPLSVSITNPKEKGWINLTLNWMDKLGVKYTNNDFTSITIQGPGHFKSFNYTPPADISQSLFFLVAGLIQKSTITMQNLDLSDSQSDKHVYTLVQELEGHFIVEKDGGISTSTQQPLCGGSIDVDTCIDALPILSVLGCFLKSPLKLYNAAGARHKECDRLSTMSVELSKLGANIQQDHESMTVYPSILKGNDVNSHNDPRVAISMIIAALCAESPSTVHHVECIDKIYPEFIEDIQQLGGVVKLL